MTETELITNENETKIKSILLETSNLILNESDIDQDTNLEEKIGLDSIKLVQIIIQLEEVFDICLDDDEDLDPDNYTTLKSISNLIKNKLQ